MKVLNLYAGIGGNRKLWEDVDITAVEIDPQIAKIYQDYFPDDKVIVGDAHQYLLDHYKDFDFIWASPPCQTHSKLAKNFSTYNIPPHYIDMKLYQEIIFLYHYFNGKYCIENVVPYYEPLIPAQKYDRHLFWCNFKIPTTTGNAKKQTLVLNQIDKKKGRKNTIKAMARSKGLEDFNKATDKGIQNACIPETGLMILNCARNIITKSNVNQLDIFQHE